MYFLWRASGKTTQKGEIERGEGGGRRKRREGKVKQGKDQRQKWWGV